MATNEARRASQRGHLAMLRNEKSPMCEADFVDLIADILICGELDYGVTATKVVESALVRRRRRLDSDQDPRRVSRSERVA